MPQKITFKTGDSIIVPDDMDVDDAVDQYVAAYMKRKGVTADPNTKEAGIAAGQQAGKQWMEENPAQGKVAAFQAGARDIGRNLAQMALPRSLEEKAGVGTEQNMAATQMEAPLAEGEPVAHMAGKVVPTLAAPAGATIPRMAAAGATFGAADAGPESRVGGAVSGGVLGGAIGGAGRVLSRALTGAAPSSRMAERAMETARNIKGGEVPFFPLSKSTNLTGEGGATRFIYDKLLANMPSASRRLNAQLDEAGKTTYRNMARQAYPKDSDPAIAALRQGDTMEDAVRAGEAAAAGSRAPSGARKVLQDSSRRAASGNPTMKDIIASANRNFPKEAQPPLRRMAQEVDAVLSSAVKEEGGLFTRQLMYTMFNVMDLATLTTVSRFLTTKTVQKYLQGTTWWQRPLRKAVKAADAAGIQSVFNDIASRAAIGGTRKEAASLRDTIENEARGFVEERM